MNPNQENQKPETQSDPSVINGRINQGKGAVKEFAGKVTHDSALRGEGKVDSLKGKAEVKAAEFKEKAKSGVAALGDAMERAGAKLTSKGHEKSGNAIRNLGDKIEHSLD